MADKQKRGSADYADGGGSRGATRAARILCLILVAMMVIGSVSALIMSFLATGSGAAAEPLLSIGIQYGDGITPAFRTYSATGYVISKQKADGDRSSVKIATVSEKTITVTVSASSVNALSVVNEAGKVIYEYETDGTYYLSLKPAGSGDVYMRTDAGYIYEGAFLYKRTGSGITVINMITLESYIEGVLPYEISSSWPMEVQKEFAVAARSFAVSTAGKHRSEGFDLCCTANCQVYRGAALANDAVKKAVGDTKGQVLMCGGKVVGAYYSSSTGGCTVSAEDCWGGRVDYLYAIDTPWERYTEYNNGFRVSEVSPADLCTYLRSRGYTELTGKIASVTVDEYAKNSSYVKSLRITDTSGHSVVITGTDRIRIAMSGYVNSANFSVGVGRVDYTVSKVVPDGEVMPYNSQNMTSFNMITAIGEFFSGLIDGPKVATGQGRMKVDGPSEYVITADNVKNGGDLVPSGYKTTYENKTVAASDPNNFLFVGKGWGHGVGLSQYGCKDLAEFGYTYDRILAAYLPDATLETLY